MTRKEQSKIDEAEADRKRLIAFSETPGFTPVSDGSGCEKNARLQHSSHPIERRRAGFPSTFGPLARRAQEQAETANESRARLLRPTIDRVAREAAAEPMPEVDQFWQRWCWRVLIGVSSAILLTGAAWWAWEADKLW